MHIIITGTRGIPARYGGFETFAQELSRRLVAAGHEVGVCVPSSHPDKSNVWEGIRRLRHPWPPGAAGVLWYDLRCLVDAYRRRPDVILNCGYGNALFLRPHHRVPVVTLTDGLEWRRAGWSWPARRWLQAMERLAVRRSRQLVSDHPAIAQHFRDTYGIDTPVIPYGAEIPGPLPPPENLAGMPEILKGRTTPGKYFLTVARFVPENHLTLILEAFRRAGLTEPLVVVGSPRDRYGRRLVLRYGTAGNILFAGAIYDKPLLDSLRQHARGYLHGHSAGGTNPALLEAMAAGNLIAAHDNPFNRYILPEGNAFFDSAGSLKRLLETWQNYEDHRELLKKEALRRLREEYDWQKITSRYLELFGSLRS